MAIAALVCYRIGDSRWGENDCFKSLFFFAFLGVIDLAVRRQMSVF